MFDVMCFNDDMIPFEVSISNENVFENLYYFCISKKKPHKVEK